MCVCVCVRFPVSVYVTIEAVAPPRPLMRTITHYKGVVTFCLRRPPIVVGLRASVRLQRLVKALFVVSFVF